MLEQLGQKPEKVKADPRAQSRSPAGRRLETVFRENQNDARLKLYADLLLGQAHLAESGQVPDPAAFSQVLADVMMRGV